MHAVEFQAAIENGIIRIPKKYKDLQEVSAVKLVVMYDENNTKRTKFDREDGQRMDSVDMIFDKFNIDFSNFKFDRDEAHER